MTAGRAPGRAGRRDDALWASVAETVRQVVLPALDDDAHAARS